MASRSEMLCGKVTLLRNDGSDEQSQRLLVYDNVKYMFGRKSRFVSVGIGSPGVERKHCCVSTAGDYMVTLENFAGVTLLNGKQMDCGQLVDLQHKDVLTICEYSFRFEYPPGSVFIDIHDRKKIVKHNFQSDSLKCTLCDYKAPRYFAAKVHHRKHSGEKPYKCSSCSFISAYKYSFIRHEHLHMKNKSKRQPYICQTCGQSFTAIRNLKQHLTIHANVKTFKCPFCSKKFNRNSNMRRHARIHSKETPFKCLECDKKFIWDSSYRKHLKRHNKM